MSVLGLERASMVYFINAIEKSEIYAALDSLENEVDRGINVRLSDLVNSGHISSLYVQQWLNDSSTAPRHRDANIGRLACQLSHVKALEFLRKSTNYSRAIIFEDDIQFNMALTHLQVRLMLEAALLDEEDGQSSLLYLGWCWECLNQDGLNPTYGLLAPVYGALCRHAIIYRREFAELYSKEWSMTENSGDGSLRDFICARGIPRVRTRIPLFVQVRKYLGSALHNKDPALPYNPPGKLKCIEVKRQCQAQHRLRTRIRSGLGIEDRDDGSLRWTRHGTRERNRREGKS